MDDRPNFVRANFEPPFVNLLGKRGLTFRLGPKSSVALAATYVDERVRCSPVNARRVRSARHIHIAKLGTDPEFTLGDGVC